MVRGCSAIGCTNSNKKQVGMSFFRVPKQPERARKWIQNCRRKGLLEEGLEYCQKNIIFCSDHFEDDQFMNQQKNR